MDAWTQHFLETAQAMGEKVIAFLDECMNKLMGGLKLLGSKMDEVTGGIMDRAGGILAKGRDGISNFFGGMGKETESAPSIAPQRSPEKAMNSPSISPNVRDVAGMYNIRQGAGFGEVSRVAPMQNSSWDMNAVQDVGHDVYLTPSVGGRWASTPTQIAV